jgi:hypothetical protein
MSVPHVNAEISTGGGEHTEKIGGKSPIYIDCNNSEPLSEGHVYEIYGTLSGTAQILKLL